MGEIYFTVDSRDGKLQLSINSSEGFGYRIAGPKYDGTSKTLLRHNLDERDVEEIKRYLRRARPSASSPRSGKEGEKT